MIPYSSIHALVENNPFIEPEPPEPGRPGTLLLGTPVLTCNVIIQQRNRQDHQQQRVLRVYCKKWSCPRCGPMLKRKWLEHLREKVLQWDGEVHTLVVDRAEWPSVSQGLRRHHASYARIEQSNGRYIVLTTGEASTVPLPTTGALAALEAAIANVTFEHRAITTSRSWAFSRANDEEPVWEKVGPLRGRTMEDVKTVLRHLGLRYISGCDSLVFRIPASWLENSERGFTNLCAWLAYGAIPCRRSVS